jgi:hypothetical protein
MGDGAEWIWTLAEPYFPGAVQIVDLFPARQHLWELALRLHPNDEVNQKAGIKAHQRRLLDKGKIEKLVCALRSIVSSNVEVAEKIRTEADYFERNAARMRYPKFRQEPNEEECRQGCRHGRPEARSTAALARQVS